MAIQPISFNGHKKKDSALNDTLRVGLKGGLGAAAGFVAGRYVLPISNDLAEQVMLGKLSDSFISENSQHVAHAKKPKVKKDDVKKETKITTPKAKTKLYTKIKALVTEKYQKVKSFLAKEIENSKIEKVQNSFRKYVNNFLAENGGKEACIKDVKKSLKIGVGKQFALFTGAIFVSAGILDLAFKPRHREHH